jgi:hypothetical protein
MVGTTPNPTGKTIDLESYEFFDACLENRWTCLTASDKETDRGDAFTAFLTRPRTPANSLFAWGGTAPIRMRISSRLIRRGCFV